MRHPGRYHICANESVELQEVHMNRWSYLHAMAVACAVAPGAQAQGLRLPGGAGTGLETLRLEPNLSEWRRASSAPVSMGDAAYLTSPDPYTREVTGGVYQPLSEKLATLVETSYASADGVTYERSVYGQVGTGSGEGWGVQAGLRHSELGLSAQPLHPYQSGALSSVDLGMLTVEHNWSRYRGAYTFYTGLTENGLTGIGHRVQVNYFYGTRSSVGVAYSIGPHLDTLGALSPYGSAETSNVGVTGEHWFSRSWAVNYNALVDSTGTQGLRPELRVGLRLSF
jgi:hypothetical protein